MGILALNLERPKMTIEDFKLVPLGIKYFTHIWELSISQKRDFHLSSLVCASYRNINIPHSFRISIISSPYLLSCFLV